MPSDTPSVTQGEVISEAETAIMHIAHTESAVRSECQHRTS